MENVGVQSIGIKLPIIREGDDLKSIVVNSVLDTVMTSYPFEPSYDLNDKDVIGITESVVARAQGNYITIDDIVQFMKERNFNKNLILFFPIMSRNRFSMILKAFSRYADRINIFIDIKSDEVGNPTCGKNLFTGVDIQKYYLNIAKSEQCELKFLFYDIFSKYDKKEWTLINCMCHPENIELISYDYTLKDIMNVPIIHKDGSKSGFNSTYGLLGSNKANEEKLKLFPDPIDGQQLIEDIQKEIFNITGKQVEVMIYGDGCFKDPIGGIWEFADPVVSPAYTAGLEGTPNEIKIKALADDQLRCLSGLDLDKAIKGAIKTELGDLKGNMISQGTTPRRYIDLLGSLMDLTSGSGDKGTPVVLVKNYFNKYCD